MTWRQTWAAFCRRLGEDGGADASLELLIMNGVWPSPTSLAWVEGDTWKAGLGLAALYCLISQTVPLDTALLPLQCTSVGGVGPQTDPSAPEGTMLAPPLWLSSPFPVAWVESRGKVEQSSLNSTPTPMPSWPAVPGTLPPSTVRAPPAPILALLHRRTPSLFCTLVRARCHLDTSVLYL